MNKGKRFRTNIGNRYIIDIQVLKTRLVGKSAHQSYFILLIISLLSVPAKLFLPEFGHVFEGFALCFWDEFPDEDGCDDADDSVEAVCEGVTEVFAH